MGEAHLPTEQSSSGEEARVPAADEHARRTRRAEGASGQGPSPAVGLIRGLRGRGEFHRLRADGRRWASGELWCVYRPASEDEHTASPRVAFAIGRSVGNAVERNRLRRRLREILRATPLPVGDYLIGAQPAAAARSFSELRSTVMALVERCAAQGERTRSPRGAAR